MAMTAQVKAELASTPITKTCCRKAEVSAILRFSGGLHIVGGRIVVEAELDTGSVARRLVKDIADVYGYTSEIGVLSAGGLRKGNRYVVRVIRDGESLARQFLYGQRYFERTFGRRSTVAWVPDVAPG